MRALSVSRLSAKVLLLALIAFNIWHAANRGVWVPMSIVNSLHLGKSVAKTFHREDTNIIAANYADDSQQAFVIAHDPLIRSKSFISLMDFPQYRYQRILYPMLCRIFSFGNNRMLPYIFFLINMLAFFGGGYVVFKIAEMKHWTKLVVIAYFANTGLLYASFNDMTESSALFFVLMGLFCWLKQRENVAVVCFSLAVLTRETFITVPFSVFVWDYIKRRRTLGYTMGLVGAVSLPLVLWCAYIQFRLPGGEILAVPPWSPPSFGAGRFSIPFVAMWQEAYYGFHHLTTHTELRRTLSLTVVTTSMIFLLIYAFFKERNFWSWIGMVQGIFVSMLRGDIWNYHLGAARVVIPLFFLFSAWCADEMKNLQGDVIAPSR